MENKRILLEKLKYQLIQVKTTIESGNDNLAIKLGMPKILSEIENELDKNAPDKERLEKKVRSEYLGWLLKASHSKKALWAKSY